MKYELRLLEGLEAFIKEAYFPSRERSILLSKVEDLNIYVRAYTPNMEVTNGSVVKDNKKL